jgi:hypothetical protein
LAASPKTPALAGNTSDQRYQNQIDILVIERGGRDSLTVPEAAKLW